MPGQLKLQGVATSTGLAAVNFEGSNWLAWKGEGMESNCTTTNYLQRFPKQADHAMTIDCVFRNSIPLKHNIMWIGGPEILSRELALFVDKVRPHVPKL